jgi:hypothetical protein
VSDVELNLFLSLNTYDVTEISSLTSVWMGVSCELQALSASPLEKDPSVLIVLEAEWTTQPD